MGITESKLNHKIFTGKILIEVYDFICEDTIKNGGEVVYYINSNFYFDLQDLISNDIQSVLIDILLPKTKKILLKSFKYPRKTEIVVGFLHFERHAQFNQLGRK